MLTLECNSLWNGLRNRTWRKWGTHNSHCTLNTVIRWVHYTIQLHTSRFCFLLNFVSFFCLFVIFLVDLNADLSFYRVRVILSVSTNRNQLLKTLRFVLNCLKFSINKTGKYGGKTLYVKRYETVIIKCMFQYINRYVNELKNEFK